MSKKNTKKSGSKTLEILKTSIILVAMALLLVIAIGGGYNFGSKACVEERNSEADLPIN